MNCIFPFVYKAISQRIFCSRNGWFFLKVGTVTDIKPCCFPLQPSEVLTLSLDMYHLRDVPCFWFVYTLAPESSALRLAVHGRELWVLSRIEMSVLPVGCFFFCCWVERVTVFSRNHNVAMNAGLNSSWNGSSAQALACVSFTSSICPLVFTMRI